MKGFVECQHFSDMLSLTNSLKNFDDEKLTSYFIFIDVEDELHSEYLKNLRMITQNSKFIALSLSMKLDEVKNLFIDGYNGYLDITVTINEFINAINSLKSNHYYLQNHMIEYIINSYIHEDNSQKKIKNFDTQVLLEKLVNFELTEKEIEVIEYLIKGFSFKQISQIIGISSFAVNQRTKSVYKKCNVKSRSELSYLLLK